MWNAGRAVAAAFVSHWICNVMIGQNFIGAVEQFGLSGVYVFFGSMALLGAMYVNSQVRTQKVPGKLDTDLVATQPFEKPAHQLLLGSVCTFRTAMTPNTATLPCTSGTRDKG